MDSEKSMEIDLYGLHISSSHVIGLYYKISFLFDSKRRKDIFII